MGASSIVSFQKHSKGKFLGIFYCLPRIFYQSILDECGSREENTWEQEFPKVNLNGRREK